MRNKIPERGIIAGLCVGLIALIWFVFGQTVRFPFINYDDPEYVYEVPEINSGLSLHNLKWAFTHWPSTNWFPVKNISHMVEFQFFGFNPGAFHFTNVALHAAAALLLFVVLRRLTSAKGQSGSDSIWRSAFVAAIFAIHPLRVESVAWIEERKDVLSGVFFMLTLAAYLYYTRKPSVARYLAMSILFTAGLLSKAMFVTTPVILLLLDYWPLGRMVDLRSFRRLLLEKIPLFILSIVDALLVSLGIAPSHAAADSVPLFERLANTALSYIVYVWQMIWPANLALFYPFPQNGVPIWQAALAAAILCGITIACFALRKSHPYLLVGWLWYLVMLLPSTGIIQFNLQAHGDRYTYLPQIGLYLMIGWGVADLLANWRYRAQVATAVAVIVIFAFAFTARAQVAYWHDSEALFTRALQRTEPNVFSLHSLASAKILKGN